jgi:muconolactone delta-isomerase
MRFLVDSRFQSQPTAEILALIPAEIAHGKQFDEQGIREQLYIATDNTRAWQIFRGDSITAVQAIVGSFPLAPFLATTITALADDIPASASTTM